MDRLEDFGSEHFELSGVIGESMEFVSANPLNYAQAISNPSKCEQVPIHGKMFLPESSQPLPAVIIVPGSLGVSENHLSHAETLLNEEIAVVVLDPFSTRGIASTVSNQTQYSFAASAFDVLAALRALYSFSQIDSTRISAQGHSRGGSAVLTAAIRAFADPIIGPEYVFKSVYAVYPWCGHQFVTPYVGTTTVRAIVGELDDWVSTQQVQSQIQAINLCGGNASIRIVPEAAHSFDKEEQLHTIPEASVSPNAPTVYLEDDGSMIDPYSDSSTPEATDRTYFLKAVEAGHGRRGAKIGGTKEQQQAFRTDMLAFHKSNFS